jgi:hypothetical protein
MPVASDNPFAVEYWYSLLSQLKKTIHHFSHLPPSMGISAVVGGEHPDASTCIETSGGRSGGEGERTLSR